MKDSTSWTARKRKAGFALPAVLLVLVALSVLGVGALTVARDEVKATDWMRESAEAFFAADAGVNHVFATWESSDYGLLMPNPGDSADLGWITIPENGASFRPTLRRIDGGTGDRRYSISVTGRNAGAAQGTRRQVLVQVRQAPGGGAWPYMMFATEKTKSSGGTYYGDLYSNGDVEVGGGGIQGDVWAAGTVSNQHLVSGTATEGAPPLSLDTIPCPSQPYGPEPLGDYGFDPVKGKLTVSGFMTLPSGTYYFNEFVQSNGGTTVPTGDMVVMYIEKKFAVSNGFVNNAAPNTADNLQVIQCGSLTGDWKFTGGTDAQLGMYAPWSKLSMTGGGDRYGTFLAWQLDKSGSGNVHHQESLSAVFGAESTAPTPVAGSWREVSF